VRALQIAMAQGTHGGQQSRGLLRVGGGLAGREKPVQFRLGKCSVEPAEKQAGAAGQSHLAKRDAQREFKERSSAGVRQACALQKGSLDFAAAADGVLGDDQQPSLRISGQLAAAPEGARRQLGLGAFRLVEPDLCGRLAGSDLLPIAPGIQECQLGGQNAVKPRQQQRRVLGLS